MKKTVNELKTIVKRITLGGNEEARKRHTSKNKLLARDRVDKLLDPKFVVFVLNKNFIYIFLLIIKISTPFLEFSQLAGYLLYEDEDVPAAGIITGIGQVEG